jgi:hypothetical protein
VLLAVQSPVFLCGRSLLILLGWKDSRFPQAIQVIPGSRFGNHIVELAHALCYANIIKVCVVYVKRDFVYLNRTVNTTSGVTISVAQHPYGQRVVVGVFYNLIRLPHCVTIDYAAIVATFRCFILENIPRPSPPTTTIFTYLRGGDIFAPPVNRYYGQPPCGYYLEAVEMDDAIDVHAISEDMKNPCLTMVLKQTGAQWRPRAMTVDITDLIYAKRMIMGRGTFSLAALWLSPFQKVVYTTAQYRGPLGQHMECFPTAAYWHTMTDNWSASAKQLHQMRAQGCKRWALER